MSFEFIKRVITSIVLLTLVFLCILINNTVFLASLAIVVLIAYYEWNSLNKKILSKKTSNSLLINILGLIYLFLIFFTSSKYLRGENIESALFFIFVLIICIFSDVGGYIIGKIFAGPKLTKISPNKTISGSIGSFTFSLIPFFLFKHQTFKELNFELSYKFLIYCFIISFICQIGDLIISYFKRLNKIKNTGKILPGHGGLLDRIDGIIFAVPFAAFLKLMNIF